MLLLLSHPLIGRFKFPRLTEKRWLGYQGEFPLRTLSMQNRIAEAWASGKMEKGANAVKERLKKYQYSQSNDHEFHAVSPAECGVSWVVASSNIITECCYHGVSEP